MEEFSFSYVLGCDFKVGKEYLKDYFKPLPNGNHLVFVENEYKEMKAKIIKRVYFKRLPKFYYDWYFKVYIYELDM